LYELFIADWLTVGGYLFSVYNYIHRLSQQTAEHKRLANIDDSQQWKLWGPYLSERQWGTVREDHSKDGSWLVV
jgi:hypothetical protein